MVNMLKWTTQSGKEVWYEDIFYFVKYLVYIFNAQCLSITIIVNELVLSKSPS